MPRYGDVIARTSLAPIDSLLDFSDVCLRNAHNHRTFAADVISMWGHISLTRASHCEHESQQCFLRILLTIPIPCHVFSNPFPIRQACLVAEVLCQGASGALGVQWNCNILSVCCRNRGRAWEEDHDAQAGTCHWDLAGLVWHGKRPKAGNGKKMEIEMENGPKLDRGKNGKKMAQKWKNNGKLHYFSIFWPFFLPFLPLSSLGPFSISISIFFPFPAFGRFPCHTSPARSQTCQQRQHAEALVCSRCSRICVFDQHELRTMPWRSGFRNLGVMFKGVILSRRLLISVY